MRERPLLRVLQKEGVFTLSEMLVTMMVMLAVMFALYNIFDMSIRVFIFGNDKVEAVEDARLGLERIEREIRAAHPYNKSDDSTASYHLVFDTSNPGTGAMPSSTQITFGNDLGATADGKIDCPNPQGKCEYITYKLASTADPSGACSAATAPRTLPRLNTNNSANSGDPVVDFVKPGGLTFTYFESDGTAPGSESEITRVLMRCRSRREPTFTKNMRLAFRGRLGDNIEGRLELVT